MTDNSDQTDTKRISNLTELYVAELQEYRSCKTQIAEVFPKLARACHHVEVREQLDSEANVAASHAQKIAGLISEEGDEADRHYDRPMGIMLHEAMDWSEQITDPDCLDAAMVASAQRVIHYLIAVSGSLSAWAKQTGRTESLDRLLPLAEEEKDADRALSALAKASANVDAA